MSSEIPILPVRLIFHVLECSGDSPFFESPFLYISIVDAQTKIWLQIGCGNIDSHPNMRCESDFLKNNGRRQKREEESARILGPPFYKILRWKPRLLVGEESGPVRVLGWGSSLSL